MQKKFWFVRADAGSAPLGRRSKPPSGAVLGSPHGISGDRSPPAGVSGDTSGPEEPLHPHQVVDGRGEGEHPAHPPDAAEAGLALQADRLQPPEDLFDPFAPALTDGVAGGPCCPANDTPMRIHVRAY